MSHLNDITFYSSAVLRGSNTRRNGRDNSLPGASVQTQNRSQGIDQANNAVAEMDKVVQQNAAGAEESASASEEMNDRAGEIKEIVNELKTLGVNQTCWR